MSSPDVPTGGYVELRGVHKRFGDVHAVRGVSLDIRQNEFVTLLGPSGCGKTTLLRLIGAFEVADQGSIRVDGVQVERVSPQQRRTRMVFQQYALFPHMTVGENVAFGLRMRHVPKLERQRRVAAALDRVHLAEKIGARPAQLSGGQQQRVALARALVTEPTVLLLDEPLAALDQQLRKSMQLELKSLQRSLGITFVYVTHDQGEALTMSDRIVVMSQGEIAQVGTGRDVYERPRNSFVARFIGETNIFNGQLVDVSAEKVVVDIDGVHLVLARPPDRILTPGTELRFMVRPEKLAITKLADDERGGLVARVSQHVYLGATTRLVLVTPRDRQLVADVTEGESRKFDGEVAVRWDPGSVWWLD